MRVECNEGWKGLYQPLIDLCQLYDIPILQIKEKFGGLRFYVGKVDNRIDTLINAAEAYSYHTCEDCGEDGVESYINYRPTEPRNIVYKATTGVSETSNWVRTLCKPCRQKWDDSRRTK